MLVNTSQAAKLLRISPRRVRALLAQGRIEGAYKLGHIWLIPLRDGRPMVIKGVRGPKSRWSSLVRKPRQENLIVIKVVQKAIKNNKHKNLRLPVVSVQPPNSKAIHVHEIEINGPCRLCYSTQPRHDKGGASVWIETHFGVELFLRDFETNALQSLGLA